jgi:hypothetical protein
MTKFAHVLQNIRAALFLMVTMGVVLAATTVLAGAPMDKPLSGTLTVEQYQVAWILSGNLGGGKLDYNGKTYDFTIGGLGVGGFGVSKIDATGEVYGLKRIEDFAGAYGQARYGIVAADVSTGELWLENTKGVVILLDAKRQGLALSVGADAIYVDLK